MLETKQDEVAPLKFHGGSLRMTSWWDCYFKQWVPWNLQKGGGAIFRLKWIISRLDEVIYKKICILDLLVFSRLDELITKNLKDHQLGRSDFLALLSLRGSIGSKVIDQSAKKILQVQKFLFSPIQNKTRFFLPKRLHKGQRGGPWHQWPPTWVLENVLNLSLSCMQGRN